MVPKPDRTFRFCNDFRRLNKVSEFDVYPIARVDELIEQLGPARFLTTLDLTKGYWQVPLTRTTREKTAFASPGGLYQYTFLPFGIHGDPATFQRMMNQLLRPHQAYAVAYIDDIIIHSASWDVHLRQLRAVLGELRKAGLTANPTKCRLGLDQAVSAPPFTHTVLTPRPPQGRRVSKRRSPPGSSLHLRAELSLRCTFNPITPPSPH